LTAESGGDAAHLTTLLTVGTSVLRLREGFQDGEWDGSCSGGDEKTLHERAASEGAVWHGRDILRIRILPCCRLSQERVDRRDR